MKLIQKFSNSSLAKTSTLVSLVSVLAVVGPFVVVSAGFWDAISHLQKEPEFFWSIQHIVVYTGVSITSCAAIIGTILLFQNSTKNSLKNGIILVIIGSLIQIVSGYADSLSHELFGIDGLISWSHQPLEFGLVLSALGGFLILKNLEKTKLRVLIPFSIISFLFFTTWLVFNLVFVFGHTIQCLPVYKIFLSGCSIL
ncbi:hypothetical protein [Nitrosarchaeum koreense]|uniref:DUF998 domain-containing protein n=1 Tax=Nitrosarchaeum koreense MY1 TaxID=1001994 RepID=F9CYC8_9ARCH|nr:hypothetical protein [Nitrosarchaeum koreense]EGP92906.1 hypothetical protein MY1_0119 [Nitrosarchaeum koreense MY1]